MNFLGNEENRVEGVNLLRPATLKHNLEQNLMAEAWMGLISKSSFQGY